MNSNFANRPAFCPKAMNASAGHGIAWTDTMFSGEPSKTRCPLVSWAILSTFLFVSTCPSTAQSAAVKRATSTTNVKVQEGDTVSSIIQRQYEIIPFSGPKYDALESEILRANKLSRPEALQIRTLKIPSPAATSTRKAASASVRTRRSSRLTAKDLLGVQVQGDPEITIRLRVDSLYSGTPLSQELVQTLAERLPARTVLVGQGDTISGIMERYYHLNQSTPKTTAMVESRILELNKLKSPEDLNVGMCAIPAIPSRMSEFKQSKLMRLGGYEEVQLASMRSTLLAFTEAEQPANVAVNASHRSTIDVKLPLSRIAILLESGVFSRGRSIASAGTTEGPLPVTLAGVGTTLVCKKVLTEFESNAMIHALSRASPGRSILAIQDTGWPSEPALIESYTNMFRIMDGLWGLLKSAPPPKYPRTIPKFTPPNSNHCAFIEAALREFRELDKAGIVQVIYLPLTQEQGAKVLLLEMLHLYRLIQRTTEEKPFDLLSSEDIRAAEAKAKKDLARIPAKWNSKTVNTDVTAVVAPFEVLSLYGERKGVFFFMNQSWTTPYRLLFVDLPPAMRGLLVAAVGNRTPSHNILTDKTEFAFRCRTSPYVVGVLNVRRGNGIDPSSSDINDDYVDKAFVAGFDGGVSEGVTGTSFSATRVAWILAAVEAARTRRVSASAWPGLLKDSLQDSRNWSTNRDKFWFNVPPYVKAMTVK